MDLDIPRGPTRRRANKEGSKSINHNWVYNNACSLPQDIHIVTYLFIGTDNQI